MSTVKDRLNSAESVSEILDCLQWYEGKLCSVEWHEPGGRATRLQGKVSLEGNDLIVTNEITDYFPVNILWITNIKDLANRRAAIAATKRKRNS